MDETTGMPRDRSPDSTLALLLDGYDFVSRRCQRYGSDVFETRLLAAPTICMRGAEAAEVFYDPDRFSRVGAAPVRVRRTLFGEQGVQSLDGEAHRHRKRMFMSLMAPEAVAELAALFAEQWEQGIDRWATSGPVRLYDEVGRMLCRSVCAWAGVPLAEPEVEPRTETLRALIESPAALGPPHWQGRRARARAEGWAGRLVESVRDGSLHAPEGRALHTIASHRDLDGRLLPTPVAAVELLNVLRPAVAVDRFVVFTACALQRDPAWHERLRGDGEGLTERFVHEVRRFYPFFPLVAARVRSTFDWRGLRFPGGRRVLLDLYGTDHHPRVWHDPERFRPERFADRGPGPFELVPQGGGDHHEHHRCPGEWITIALMKVAVTALTERMSYAVPAQDLRLSRRRIPPLPHSGFVVDDVRPVA